MSVTQAKKQLELLRRAEAARNASVVVPSPVDLFTRAWGVPDEWQVDALTSEWQRLLLNCSRQAGKSTVSSTIGVHVAASVPGALVLLLSPTLRQSAELFDKCKHVWQASVGDLPRLVEDNKLSLRAATGSRIVSLPGKPETIRGFSAVKLLLVDEGSFVGDTLFTAVRPMLAVSHGRLAVLSSPFGKRGEFYRMCDTAKNAIASGEQSPYHYIEVPATKVPRITPDFLEEERIALGPLFDQEYMCQFLDSETAMFSYEVIQQALDDGEEVARWF